MEDLKTSMIMHVVSQYDADQVRRGMNIHHSQETVHVT